MKRMSMYLSAVAAVGGMAALAAAQPPAAGAPPAAPAPAALTARPTVAVFNMAAVMRDYGKAKYQVYTLGKKRDGMSGDLNTWRGEFVKLQNELQLAKEPNVRDGIARKLLDLQRKIEDKGREIDKLLNDEASDIISKLYDDIKAVVDATAGMNQYHLVLAYPDAVTEEEKRNPYLRELKLKPPAAQPFYVHPQIDITGIVVSTLNKWYPAPEVPKDAPAPAPPGASVVPGTQPPALPGAGVPGLPPVGLPKQ